MRSLAIPAVVAAAIGFSNPVLAQTDSAIGAPPVTTQVTTSGQPMVTRPMVTRPLIRRPSVQRGVTGLAAPYRQPYYGYQLPRDWMVADQFIGDYGALGLGRPAAGFGWSRYYDVAVLTDQWGRVYDWRDGMNWDRGGGDFDTPYGETGERRRGDGSGSGIGGAVAGAVVGSIAGNLIGGSGNRLPGSLIGGGVGALAGLAIDREVSRHRGGGLFGRHRHHHDDRDDDRYDRRDHDYGRGGWMSGPHWGGGSYGSTGYDGGGSTVTTVVVHAAAAAPVMQTRTYTSYEYVSVPVKRRVHHYRPRPKPQCVCGS